MTVKIVMPSRRRSDQHSLQMYVLVLSIFITSCSVQFVSPYDPVIDKGLTEYYESMAVFLSEMERASANGAAKAAFS